MMTRLLCVSPATGPHHDNPGCTLAGGHNRPTPGARNPHRDGTGDMITVRLEESVAGNEGFPALSGALLAYAVPCPPIAPVGPA